MNNQSKYKTKNAEARKLMEVIYEFSSESFMREWLQWPYLMDGMIVATNARYVCCAPAELTDYQDDEIGKNELIPDGAKQILLRLLNYSITDHAKVSIRKVREILEKLDKQDVFDDCIECEGHGTADCPCCGNESNCDECGGSGNGKNKVGISYQYHFLQNEYSFWHVAITPDLLNDIITAFENLEINEVEVGCFKEAGKKQYLSFYGGSLRVVLVERIKSTECDDLIALTQIN